MEGGSGWLYILISLRTKRNELRLYEYNGGGSGWRTMELLKIDFYIFFEFIYTPAPLPRVGTIDIDRLRNTTPLYS